MARFLRQLPDHRAGLPEVTWGAPATLARLGLTKALTVVGMVAEQLAMPAGPLPEVETMASNDTEAGWPSRT